MVSVADPVGGVEQLGVPDTGIAEVQHVAPVGVVVVAVPGGALDPVLVWFDDDASWLPFASKVEVSVKAPVPPVGLGELDCVALPAGSVAVVVVG